MLLRQGCNNGIKDRIVLTAVGFEEGSRCIEHIGVNRLDQKLPGGNSGDNLGDEGRLLE